MLRELRIENLLLIERAELRFGAGLNAVTGETGAGKTVLAHSLDLLLGGKPRSGIVRPGAEEAWVEGCFDLDPALREDPELAELLDRVPAGDDQVVLARRVSAAGRSTAFVAGRAATAADLRALGLRTLAFYGQHEHRRLTLSSAQGEILDSFAGPEHLATRDRYRHAHRRVGALEREREELLGRDGARERDLDLLRFELAEIEEVEPSEEERRELLGERERLRGVEGLREAAGSALARLTGIEEDGGGTATSLAAAEADLVRGGGVDQALDAAAARITALVVELEDASADLRSYLDSLQADPARLEVVELRLEAVERLIRKHGGSVADVLAHAERCRERIAAIEGAEDRAGELEAAITEAGSARAALAGTLSGARKEAATELERRVTAELTELAMEGAKIEVLLRDLAGGFGPSGAETVELMVATNPGLPLSPLGETASGGELSRVMLALTGLGSGAEAETLVFDEIDAGIGGKVARRVGERLRSLAEGRQVICITHLPQVAAMAAAHFRVEKGAPAAPEGAISRATVERVDGEALVAEIVRMLGADDADQAADRHARELLAA